MKPVSAAQMVIDASRGSGNTAGARSLMTNRGNSISYIENNGIVPPPTTVVRDTGESVAGDGLSWIVEWAAPVLVSGLNDAGLKVRIIYGEGGAQQSIILNANPGFSITVPSTSIDVQVFSDSPAGSVPDSNVTVNALLYRGFPANPGGGQLSFLITALGDVVTPIPNYARTLRVYGDETLSGIFIAPSHLIIDGGAAGTLADYSAATLQAMFKNGDAIAIPGGAVDIRTTVPAGLSYLLDFGIEL